MFEALEIDLLPTDGEIAVINLDSARRRSWTRFFADPLQGGVAETLLEQEQLTAQFAGHVEALDRLEALVGQLAEFDATSARTALIQAQVASMVHRFADARQFHGQWGCPTTWRGQNPAAPSPIANPGTGATGGGPDRAWHVLWRPAQH